MLTLKLAKAILAYIDGRKNGTKAKDKITEKFWINEGYVTEKDLDMSKKEILLMKVKHLGLSAKIMNRLLYADIKYLGDLVQKTDEELLELPFFGVKSLRIIKSMLGIYGLTLGMRLAATEYTRPEEKKVTNKLTYS